MLLIMLLMIANYVSFIDNTFPSNWCQQYKSFSNNIVRIILIEYIRKDIQHKFHTT